MSEYSRNGVSKFGLDTSGSGLDLVARPVNTVMNTRLKNTKTSATSFSGCSMELADYNITLLIPGIYFAVLLNQCSSPTLYPFTEATTWISSRILTLIRCRRFDARGLSTVLSIRRKLDACARLI